MELRKNWRKLTTALSRFWHREAGQMFRAIPPTVILFRGGGLVRRLELCPASFSGA